MCCRRLAENTGSKIYGKTWPSAHHRTIVSGYISQQRHVSTIGINLSVKQQYLLHKSSQCGERGPTVTAEIGSGVCGTRANFNGFHVLASLLSRRRSTEVNQTLHDVWLSRGLVHYIYIFGISCPMTEFCQVQNSLCVQVLRCPILAALLHDTRAVESAKLCVMVS